MIRSRPPRRVQPRAAATLDASPALLPDQRFADEPHALVMRFLRNR